MDRRLNARLWMLLLDPDLSVEKRAAHARRLWRRWHFDAVAGAATLSRSLLGQLAQSPARSEFRPYPPPADVRYVAGDATGEVSLRTWNIVAGSLLSETEGIGDPFVDDELRAAGDAWQGGAVLLCGWWGLRAVAHLAVHDRDAFSGRIKVAHAEWSRLAS